MTANMNTRRSMSLTSLLETCNDLFANVPLLSDDQYQLLFQLDKHLTNAGVQTNLSSTAHRQNSRLGELPLTASEEVTPSSENMPNCSHQRHDFNMCLSCSDLAGKRNRWEALFERYKAMKRELVAWDMSSSEPQGTDHHSHLQERGIIVVEQHIDEIIPDSPLLRLQGCERRTFNHASNDIAPEAWLEQGKHPLRSQDVSESYSRETSERPPSADRLTSHVGKSQEQGWLTCGRVALPKSPAQHPQVDTLQQEMTPDIGEHRVHWPSICFPSHHDNDQIPHVSYFLEDGMQLSKLQSQDTICQNNHSNQQDITPTTSPNRSALVPVQNAPTSTPSISNPIQMSPDSEQSCLKSAFKKDTQSTNKKPYVSIRRWSQTYLNGLIHKQRPRNLPDGLELTDHINVQDLPLERLVLPIKAVDTEVDREIRFLGAGTRIEVAMNAARSWDEPLSDEIVIEEKKVFRQTPFRLVTMDKEGRILIDMNWVQDVTPLEHSTSPVLNIESQAESLAESGAFDGQQGKCCTSEIAGLHNF